MLKYFVNVDGSEVENEVTVTEKEGLFEVVIDGETHNVDFHETGDRFYSIIIDNKSYEVDMAEKDGKYEILRDGDLFQVEILDEMKKLMKERGAAALQGRQVIDTQMPGMILKVMVEEGEEVTEGQPLLILVAMKMENEIKAPKDGVVQEIFVAAEQTVASGDKLVVVE